MASARRWRLLFILLFTTIAAVPQQAPAPPAAAAAPEISRPTRPWEFLSAVGRKAGLCGNEAGTVEAWAYPLELVRDFGLVCHGSGRSSPAAALARTITARPEAV